MVGSLRGGPSFAASSQSTLRLNGRQIGTFEKGETEWSCWGSFPSRIEASSSYSFCHSCGASERRAGGMCALGRSVPSSVCRMDGRTDSDIRTEARNEGMGKEARTVTVLLNGPWVLLLFRPSLFRSFRYYRLDLGQRLLVTKLVKKAAATDTLW